MSAIVIVDRWLRVPIGDGHVDVHHRWLRHQSPASRHPITGERTLCSSELADDVRPLQASIEGSSLRVRWSDDGHVAEYDLGWLAEHAYARDRVDVPPPPSDLARIELDGSGDLGDLVRRAVARIDEQGAVLVRRPHARPEEETEAIVDAFAASAYRVVPTHFGRIEDLRTDNTTNANTDQLGYTDSAIDLHTDQPFLEKPPRLQLLHGIRSAERGGENMVADALAAARYLEATDARAVELLTTTPVTFHRKQKTFEKILHSPIVQLESVRAGQPLEPFQVRASYFTLAPYRLPFAKMEEWYRAHDAFFRLVRDPRHQYRFALGPGDFLLYDNHRMLHGRTAFRGARWVRGVYFDPV